MHELRKTLAFVAVAAVLLTTAVLATWAPWASARAVDDQGQRFFPDFNLPEQATTLEVVDIDPETSSALPFKVTFKDGRWVIPSHSDYPADARDRLARTAAGILDLTKDTIRTDRPEDHRAMGVVDPLDPKVTSTEGLGRRITIRDKTDKLLADLIVGKPVPNQPDQRFVRVPGQNRVYGVRLTDVEISSRFADWIETDLLKLNPGSIRRIDFDTEKLDIRRRQILPGEMLTVRRAAPAAGGFGRAVWSLDQPIEPGRELNTQALDTLASTLADLRIVGVRPKPQGLAAALQSEGGARVDSTEAFESLASKGFYLLKDPKDGQPRLYSNDGNVYVACDDGVVYTLRFGGVIFARDKALSAGTADEAATEAKPEGAGDLIESRFLFVNTRFEPALVTKPAPRGQGELPDDVFQRTKAEREAMERRADAEAKRAREEYEKKLADGQKRASDLAARFADWYYVVPGESYRKVMLDRASLTRVIGSEPAHGTAPGGLPNFPGGIPGQPSGGAFLPGD